MIIITTKEKTVFVNDAEVYQIAHTKHTRKVEIVFNVRDQREAVAHYDDVTDLRYVAGTPVDYTDKGSLLEKTEKALKEEQKKAGILMNWNLYYRNSIMKFQDALNVILEECNDKKLVAEVANMKAMDVAKEALQAVEDDFQNRKEKGLLEPF